MPKRSKYPKLRVSVKRGKAGQVWTSYWYDNRGTGKSDIPLGNDYAAALQKWAEIRFDAPLIAGTLEEAFRGWEQRGLENRPDGRPRSAETVRGYKKCLSALRPVFKAARWEEVTLPKMVEYRRERPAKGRARQELQVLSVIWGWARIEGLTTLKFPGEGMQRTGWKGAAGVRQVEVSATAFAALHKHSDQTLRDALDIASATGLRVTDVLELRMSDVRDGKLISTASKTGKRGEFDLAASQVLQPIIDRRKANKRAQHLFLLAAGKNPVTYRALAERFTKARTAAAKEVPECAGLWLRDMRKMAGQLAPSLAEASKLLQHSSLSVTQRHYRQGDKLKPVR